MKKYNVLNTVFISASWKLRAVFSACEPPILDLRLGLGWKLKSFKRLSELKSALVNWSFEWGFWLGKAVVILTSITQKYIRKTVPEYIWSTENRFLIVILQRKKCGLLIYFCPKHLLDLKSSIFVKDGLTYTWFLCSLL